MPPFTVTLEGKIYDVDAANEQAAAFAAHQVHSGSMKRQEPTQPTQVPTFGERLSTGFGDVGRGMIQGARNVGAGLLALPGALARMPGQVVSDVGALVSNPSEAIPAQFERAKRFAWGAVPFSESMSDVAAGKPLTLENLARQGTEFGLSVRAPQVAVEAIPAVTKAVTRRLPGASVELNELASGRLRALPEAYRPEAGAAQRAYAAAEAMGNPRLSMEPMRETAQRLLDKELSLSSPDKSFISLLKNALKTSDGGWSFQRAQAEVVDWGEKIGQIAASKGTRLGELRDLLGSLHESLADAQPMTMTIPGRAAQPAGMLTGASGQPLVPAQAAIPPTFQTQPATAQTLGQRATWSEAQRLARRNFAANELKQMVESGIITTGDQVQQINVNPIITKIERMAELAPQNKRAQLFVGSFDPGELQEIVTTLKDIGSQAPKVPPGSGVNVGSYRRVRQVGLGGLAAGTPGAYAGPLVADLISSGLMTAPGRRLVRWSVSPTMGLSPQNIQLLGAYLRAQNGDGSLP